MEKEVLYHLDPAKDGKLTITKGNSKLGDGIYTFSTLPGDKDHILTIHNGETILTNIEGTCSGHCDVCFSHGCYAVRSAQQYHKQVIPAWGGNTILLRTGKLFDEIDAFITRKNAVALRYHRTPEVRFFRINVSGEITCVEDLINWNTLALRHPEVQFCLYTKNYEALDRFSSLTTIKERKRAKNFVINVSQWHHCADEFLAKHPDPEEYNVFEYDDRNKDSNTLPYDDLVRLGATPHCPAVDTRGHHTKDASGEPITCTRCQRCYKNGNITAVYAH